MSVRKSLFFSFLDRYSGLVLSIISSMIIARLLSPEEIGVFSIAMVLSFFVSSIRDAGAGTYLVQAKNIDESHQRAVWTVQLGMGLLLAFIVLLAARPVSVFYGEPQIFGILLLLALNFLISPFGSLTYALLMRESYFGKLALMRFSSSLAGALVSVTLAYLDYGAISLAYGSLAATVVNALVAQLFRPKKLPFMPGGFSKIREVFSFGSKISGTTLFNSLVYGSPELMLGKFQDMVSVGYFSRSNGLITMFNKLVLDAVSSVALTAFARANREGENVSHAYVRATAYITVLGWIFFGLIIIFPLLLLRTLYGAQWDDVAPLLRVMAFGMLIGAPAGLCVTTLISIGRATVVFKTTLLVGSIYFVAMGIGAFGGISLIGQYFVVSNACAMIIWLVVTKSHLDFAWSELRGVLWLSAKVALMTLLPCISFILIYGEVGVWHWTIFFAGFMGAGLFFCSVKYFKHPIYDEVERGCRALNLSSKSS